MGKTLDPPPLRTHTQPPLTSKPMSNARTPTECSGACPDGQYTSTACSSTADRECSACTGIAHSNNKSITCTSAINQRGDRSKEFACDQGYVYIAATESFPADTCRGTFARLTLAFPAHLALHAPREAHTDRSAGQTTLSPLSECKACSAGTTFITGACAGATDTVCTDCAEV